ncbi:MAG: FlgO family outer membrane protein [Elusimicrobia bacterium]|nr:FlgO family outer membrane protein [Elusimicrobiota bacterium]
MADGYDRIAGKIAVAAKGLKRRRIAVLQFPYIDNRNDIGSRVVQEQLMIKLVAYRELQVVERASLGQMVEEITLSYRGLLDSRASYQLGQILDVDAVLTGTLVELPNRQIQVNARLIRIPDGLILAAVESLVKRTWQDGSAPPDPPSLQKWVGNIFGPASSNIHQEDDINKFIQEQFEALNAAASASPPAPRAVPVADSPIFSLFADPSSPDGSSKKMLKGRLLYEQSCTYCHGPQGKGSQAMAEIFGLSAVNLDINLKSLERYSAKDLITRLKSGDSRMPVYQKSLAEEDASALLQYLRHLTSSFDCPNARARVDELERDVLELKARYWALELRKSKTSIAGAPKEMTSAILDPAIKSQFYDSLNKWSATDHIPALTPAEVKRFVDSDGQAFSLRQNCGL